MDRSFAILLRLIIAGLLGLLARCGGDSSEEDAGDRDSGLSDAGFDAGRVGFEVDGGPVPRPDAGGPPRLYGRLGGELGIIGLVDDFLAKVVADPKVNGYFLNDAVDLNRLERCLVKYIGKEVGGPQTYPGPQGSADAEGCRNLAEAHRGLNISTADFDDFRDHFLDSLLARFPDLSDPDRLVLVQALTSTSAREVVIEDASSDLSVYQRLGRKPEIQALIDDFTTRVFGDPSINGFFETSSAAVDRRKTCLVRQLCSFDGPCVYAGGLEPALFGMRCRAIAAAHLEVTNPRGGAGRRIGRADFDAYLLHLVEALNARGVSTTDRTEILDRLNPLCTDLVATSSTCPS